jgi:hypothetical protein
MEDLSQYVNEVLCDQNELVLGVFEFTERTLVRNGRKCGKYFCLHGPRAVKFSAIWETERNTILFYGPTGERTAKVQLASNPSWETAAA